jgi:hypothetical protein
LPPSIAAYFPALRFDFLCNLLHPSRHPAIPECALHPEVGLFGEQPGRALQNFSRLKESVQMDIVIVGVAGLTAGGNVGR